MKNCAHKRNEETDLVDRLDEALRLRHRRVDAMAHRLAEEIDAHPQAARRRVPRRRGVRAARRGGRTEGPQGGGRRGGDATGDATGAGGVDPRHAAVARVLARDKRRLLRLVRRLLEENPNGALELAAGAAQQRRHYVRESRCKGERVKDVRGSEANCEQDSRTM